MLTHQTKSGTSPSYKATQSSNTPTQNYTSMSTSKHYSPLNFSTTPMQKKSLLSTYQGTSSQQVIQKHDYDLFDLKTQDYVQPEASRLINKIADGTAPTLTIAKSPVQTVSTDDYTLFFRDIGLRQYCQQPENEISIPDGSRFEIHAHFRPSEGQYDQTKKKATVTNKKSLEAIHFKIENKSKYYHAGRQHNFIPDAKSQPGIIDAMKKASKKYNNQLYNFSRRGFPQNTQIKWI